MIDKTKTGRAEWRMARRICVALACLATAIALFYTEEDWRGKHAWEERKRELKAKGEWIEWASLIPPAVPDDQNFYRAPGIDPEDWTGRGGHALSKRIAAAAGLEIHSTGLTYIENATQRTNATLLAKITVTAENKDRAVLRWGDSDATAKARQLIEEVVGRYSESALDFPLVGRRLEGLPPARIAVWSDRELAARDLTNWFPESLRVEQAYLAPWLRVEASGPGKFRVELPPGATTRSAPDYLERTASLAPVFDQIRAAAARPYARMDGDYQQPYLLPIPNFVLHRALAQTLANRAKCHLLTGDPVEALQDVTLIHRLCQVLENRPSRKTMTLVQAMIHVAIDGLYADTIADGMRLEAWREPQLEDLERQLADEKLIPILVESLREERTSRQTTLERTPPGRLYDLLRATSASATWWKKMKDPLGRYLAFAPRGWIYQNIAVCSKLPPGWEIGDGERSLVFPEKNQKLIDESTALSASAPYSYLDMEFIPNFTRAWETAALNQTKVNEARVACALERFRLARGGYPQRLGDLAPDFIDALPHDVIGGGPLIYKRTANGFLLYSVGWNGTDDGGKIAWQDNRYISLEAGDWVWRNGGTSR